MRVQAGSMPGARKNPALLSALLEILIAGGQQPYHIGLLKDSEIPLDRWDGDINRLGHAAVERLLM